MKRQKRDRMQRAFSRGYHAGLAMRSKTICPHHELDTKEQWLCGWRAGRADVWEGKYPH